MTLVPPLLDIGVKWAPDSSRDLITSLNTRWCHRIPISWNPISGRRVGQTLGEGCSCRLGPWLSDKWSVLESEEMDRMDRQLRNGKFVSRIDWYENDPCFIFSREVSIVMHRHGILCEKCILTRVGDLYPTGGMSFYLPPSRIFVISLWSYKRIIA